MTHEPELAIERDVPQLVPQLDAAAKRALIETELRKDGSRADREIARIVSVAITRLSAPHGLGWG